MSKSIRCWADAIHENATLHGWWDDAATPEEKHKLIPEKLLLVITELAEAVEDYRVQRMDTYIGAGGKPEGFWVEVADAVIRVLDLAGAHKVDLEHIIELKHEYNKTRPMRHGGKVI